MNHIKAHNIGFLTEKWNVRKQNIRQLSEDISVKDRSSHEFSIQILREKKFDEVEHQDNFTVKEINGIKVAVPKKQVLGQPILINQSDLDKKFDRSFCEINPKINEFASQSPDNLFFVIFLAMASKGISWPEFRDMMPVLAKFIQQSDGTVEKIESLYDLKGNKRNVAGWFRTSHALSHGNLLWKKRIDLYEKIYNQGYIENTLKLYIYLSNIVGLSTVKAAFVVQLLSGRLGCIDNINTDIYGIPIEIANVDQKAGIGFTSIAKATVKGVKTEEPTAKGFFVAKKYIEFLNAIAASTNSKDISQSLWDHWVQLSAAKAYYQGSGHIQLKLIDGQNVIMPVYKNKKSTQDYQKELKSKSGQGNPYGASDISSDHYTLPKIASELKNIKVESHIKAHNIGFLTEKWNVRK